MTELRRLLKPRFLGDYLAEAVASFPEAVLLAVLEGGKPVAAAGAGDAGRRLAELGDGGARFPLTVNGATAGEVVVAAKEGDAAGVDTLARFIARSLQAIVDAEAARRAVSAETLQQYREISLLHRAALALNRSLEAPAVAEALLAEFQDEADPENTGLVLVRSEGGGFLPLAAFRAEKAPKLSAITESALFQDVVAHGKGEIINDLPSDSRWRNEVPDIFAVLMVPLMARDRCSGALVLATTRVDAGYHASDLLEASTLGSMAAGALRNAQLFEEVLGVKNFNESVLRSLSNGVVTLDGAGKVTKANEAALRILKRDGGDLLSFPVSEVLGAENAWVLDLLESVQKGGRSEAMFDREIRMADGSGTSVNLSAIALIGIDERPIGSMLVLEDITREKRIKNTMSRFMSDKVLDSLLEADESILGGKEQEVTVLFSDMRRFTSLTEALSPGDTVAMLNEYFTEMVEVIFEHGGTLDKFIGDAIMAIFGAPIASPLDADEAVSSAVAMLRALRDLNRRRSQAGHRAISIGIGLNTGRAVAGYIGSPKRMDYTVVGDMVNLASRLESANKHYGTQILVTSDTYQALRDKRLAREIDRVRVQGKTQAVTVYEILDHLLDGETPGIGRVARLFQEGVDDYRERRWSQASKAFAEVIQLRPTDRPALIYLQRCLQNMEAEPGPDWDGMVSLASK
ncbi:MAG: PAS domain-containing protein [Rhodospirillales bacterium]|nr:PAS domain-containing protein [Rhodospirillales bacterium]